METEKTNGGNGSSSTSTALVPIPATSMMQVFRPQNFSEALEIARTLQKSGFLGDHIKTPEQALTIMLSGAELGLPPMEALRDLFVIHGKTGMYADLMVAMVRRSGVCKYFRRVEVSEDAATYETLRSGDPAPVKLTFTMADADRAGYVKQNPKYKSDPKAMLASKAKAILCKDVYPDVIRGMAAREDLDDEPRRFPVIDAEVTPISPQPAAVQAPVTPATKPADTTKATPAAPDWDELIAGAKTVIEVDAIKKRIITELPEGQYRKEIGRKWAARKEQIEAAAAANADPATGEVPAGEPPADEREPGAEG